MKITIVSATNFEIQPLSLRLENEATKISGTTYMLEQNEIQILITGVGAIQMAVNCTLYNCYQKPELLIHAGISGSYNKKFALGEVVFVSSEQFGDIGIEEADGTFSSAFENGLIDKNQFPFVDGLLLNPKIPDPPFLPLASGLTFNKVSGYPANIENIKKQFAADLESMEGAAFFYSCLNTDIDFISLRAISNYVERRDKSKWKTKESIQNLNQTLWEMIEML